MNEKFIEKKIKRFFKNKPQFKRVYSVEECDGYVFFAKDGMLVVAMDDKCNFNLEQDINNEYYYFFIKNKNPHDGQRSSHSFIKRRMKNKT